MRHTELAIYLSAFYQGVLDISFYRIVIIVAETMYVYCLLYTSDAADE